MSPRHTRGAHRSAGQSIEQGCEGFVAGGRDDCAVEGRVVVDELFRIVLSGAHAVEDPAEFVQSGVGHAGGREAGGGRLE